MEGPNIEVLFGFKTHHQPLKMGTITTHLSQVTQARGTKGPGSCLCEDSGYYKYPHMFARKPMAFC